MFTLISTRPEEKARPTLLNSAILNKSDESLTKPNGFRQGLTQSDQGRLNSTKIESKSNFHMSNQASPTKLLFGCD